MAALSEIDVVFLMAANWDCETDAMKVVWMDDLLAYAVVEQLGIELAHMMVALMGIYSVAWTVVEMAYGTAALMAGMLAENWEY